MPGGERRGNSLSRRPLAGKHSTGGRGSWAGSGLVLGLLLALPIFALVRLAASVDWRLLVAVPVVASFATFLAYRTDKQRARNDGWRIRESLLHAGALAGGWPGGFLAQRLFRHKTAKMSFQVTFWLIVLLHQLVALDCLLDFRFLKEIMRVFSSRGL